MLNTPSKPVSCVINPFHFPICRKHNYIKQYHKYVYQDLKKKIKRFIELFIIKIVSFFYNHSIRNSILSKGFSLSPEKQGYINFNQNKSLYVNCIHKKIWIEELHHIHWSSPTKKSQASKDFILWIIFHENCYFIALYPLLVSLASSGVYGMRLRDEENYWSMIVYKWNQTKIVKLL